MAHEAEYEGEPFVGDIGGMSVPDMVQQIGAEDGNSLILDLVNPLISNKIRDYIEKHEDHAPEGTARRSKEFLADVLSAAQQLYVSEGGQDDPTLPPKLRRIIMQLGARLEEMRQDSARHHEARGGTDRVPSSALDALSGVRAVQEKDIEMRVNDGLSKTNAYLQMQSQRSTGDPTTDEINRLVNAMQVKRQAIQIWQEMKDSGNATPQHANKHLQSLSKEIQSDNVLLEKQTQLQRAHVNASRDLPPAPWRTGSRPHTEDEFFFLDLRINNFHDHERFI